MKSLYGLFAVSTSVLVAALGCSADLGSAGSSVGRGRGRPMPMELPSEPAADGGYEEPNGEPVEEPEECDPQREYANGHPCLKEQSDCWVTAGGKIEGGGSFGGNAKPFGDGWVGGEWNHVTGDGHHLHGSPLPDAALDCDYAGGPDADHPIVDVNRIVFHGEGSWDGEPCYFRITLVDHGEPGTLDEYSLVVAQNPWTAPFYTRDGVPIASGSVQIHPLNGGHP